MLQQTEKYFISTVDFYKNHGLREQILSPWQVKQNQNSLSLCSLLQ